MKKIAINGFGRIGRLIFRQMINDKNIKIVAINDLNQIKSMAHLLKYDTAQGSFQGSIEIQEQNLIVEGKKIKIFSEKDPSKLPWKELEVDIVVESTGIFITKDLATNHLKAGAKKVLISAPAKSSGIKTIVYSVNHNILTKDDQIVSGASCTTNALAPVVNILNKNFGFQKGFMTTVHAYTADQSLQDGPHKDLRRARAGAQNFVPTTTGAAIAVGKVLPELNGKLDGIAIRGPIITGSIIDLVFELKNSEISIEDINKIMNNSSSESFCYTEDPIVSSDVIGSTHALIFDAQMTKKISVDNKSIFKILVWYDNENSYVSQYVRTLKYFINL